MEATAGDNVVPLRKRHPRDDVWDACEAVLGYKPLTDTEKSLWGKKITSLYNAGATADRIHAVAKWYHKQWPNVDLTIGALEKWYSHFLRMETKRQEKRAAICPECEMGGGQHAADCPSLDRG